MIDESRDDGFDNDNDWDSYQDDLGMDGAENTGDPGEGDLIATSGAGTDRPGEPNIDKTDIDESDQIGLTSFYFFAPFNIVKLNNDSQLWNTLRPGFFNVGRRCSSARCISRAGCVPRISRTWVVWA